MNKKFIIFFLPFILASCANTPSESISEKESISAEIEEDPKRYLNGVDEPIFGSQVNGFNTSYTADLVSALGAKSFRFRFPNNMYDGNSLNSSLVMMVHEAEQLFLDKDISLLGQISVFPTYTSFIPDSYNSAPRSDDPSYLEWMNAVSDYYEAVTREFPNILYWEMGNETNDNVFFHPNGYTGSFTQAGGGGYSDIELASVQTDFYYYASKGIHKGNPNAIAVTPGYSPKNYDGDMKYVKSFLTQVYNNINSGNYPSKEINKSTDPNDYFEVLCYHPYSTVIDDNWKQAHIDVHKICEDNGQPDIKVFFSEYGYTDLNDMDSELTQIESFEKAYNYCLNELPFVERLMAFRLYNCKGAESWGGLGETTFGYFKEPEDGHGFAPKMKAFALQELYKGEGDLYCHY